MAHPDHSSQREGCLAEQGWDWEVSRGLGMGTVPFGSEGEHAGSFYVHEGCATCPVPAAPEGRAETRREQIPSGGNSLRRGSVKGRGQGAAC